MLNNHVANLCQQKPTSQASDIHSPVPTVLVTVPTVLVKVLERSRAVFNQVLVPFAIS